VRVAAVELVENGRTLRVAQHYPRNPDGLNLEVEFALSLGAEVAPTALGGVHDAALINLDHVRTASSIAIAVSYAIGGSSGPSA
jgi:hypothetical protein